MPLSLDLTFGDLGEGANATKPEIVDPSLGLGDCGLQSIASLGFHCRLCAGLKTMFNWAVEQDILAASPCAGLKPPTAEVSRDRTLADQLGAVWRACLDLGKYIDWHGEEVTPAYGAVIRMLALTGQRLREVSEMKWAEVDLDARTWPLPRERCKNGHAHVVPLSDQALAIIGPFKRANSDSDLVFGVSGFSRAKKALDALVPS